MLIIPLRTDRALRHTPWVNYLLIMANVLLFLWSDRVASSETITKLILTPFDPHLHQFITYQFLHAGWMHLLGNMLFLYVFGNSVEDRLGKVGYLAFYLAGGVIAGLGFSLLEDNPVLGASGSVAAVTGAYLALFPLSNVTLFFFFFFIGTFEISSLLLIVFQMSQDIVLFLMNQGGVAYLAHISGYAFGFLVGMSLLWTRLLPREPYDMLALIEQKRRRAQFRAMTKKGYHPWESAGKPGVPGSGSAPQISERDQLLMDLRSVILSKASQHDYAAASQAYLRLLQTDPDQVMPPQVQLDIANHLAGTGEHTQAAGAYEMYLNTYKSDAGREQVQLMLGLIYANYLGRRQRARELLAAAKLKLTDPDLKAMAEAALAKINAI